jgi:SAM-dependent methyltransferase
MNTSRPSDPTTDYYDRNAEAFVAETLGVSMEGLYQPFLALLPPGSHILDAGCGSGRDVLEFSRRGFRVTAIEASPALARLASDLLGQPVQVLRFQEMRFEEQFDGIWACASLLHVLRAEMDCVVGRFTGALRPGGVWYVSFKLGEAEEVRGGRLFSDYTEQGLRALMTGHPLLTIERLWVTEDVRPGKKGNWWLNAVIRKKSSG